MTILTATYPELSVAVGLAQVADALVLWLGFLVGAVVRRRNREREIPFAVPRWSIAVGGVFGAFFCAASLWLALSPAGAG